MPVVKIVSEEGEETWEISEQKLDELQVWLYENMENDITFCPFCGESALDYECDDLRTDFKANCNSCGIEFEVKRISHPKSARTNDKNCVDVAPDTPVETRYRYTGYTPRRRFGHPIHDLLGEDLEREIESPQGGWLDLEKGPMVPGGSSTMGDDDPVVGSSVAEALRMVNEQMREDGHFREETREPSRTIDEQDEMPDFGKLMKGVCPFCNFNVRYEDGKAVCPECKKQVVITEAVMKLGDK